jgi:hypothetical protein
VWPAAGGRSTGGRREDQEEDRTVVRALGEIHERERLGDGADVDAEAIASAVDLVDAELEKHHLDADPLQCRQQAGDHQAGDTVTLVFRKKTKCKPICMPGSIFMHTVDISE